MNGRGAARAATLGLSLMVSLGAAQGTRDITSLAEERYDARIPAPEAVLGAPLASRYARAHELAEYIRLLDSASPRVVSVNLGRSYQGREITAAIITSPENHARIKEIQTQNRRIFFDSASVTDEEIKTMPTVMWMGYGVHGNEASTSEAALATLYHLAAGTGKVPALLKDMVIILMPSLNPDGRDRFANHANGFRGLTPTPDRQDREHDQPWPGGRTNHFWFDLNRDWMPLTQVESQVRHRLYTAWRPQVTLDFHEQGLGLNYFFQPGEPLRVNALTPRENQAITADFAQYHAKALEALNERYFTEERFDDFYIGKGSTYPDVIGSIGILFEQASTGGIQSELRGRLYTFADSVRNQFATSMSSLEAAQANRVRLLTYQRNFFRDDVQLAGGVGTEMESTTIGWQWPVDDRGRELASLLRAHEIRVDEADGWMEVRLNQPLHRLARAMIAPPNIFEDTSFYDISTWGLAYGSLAKVSPITGTRGRPFTRPEGPTFRRAENPVGLIIHRGRADFHDVVRQALRLRLRVFFVKEAIGEAQPGDVFIAADAATDVEKWRGAWEGSKLRIDMQEVAGQTGAVVSWGGRRLVELGNKRIALIADATTSSNRAGELWYRLPDVSVVPASANLANYDVVIYPGGGGAEFMTRLGTFVSGGGHLVAVGDGALAVANSDIWRVPASSYSANVAGLKFGEIADERSRHQVPGTILRVRYDDTHPLTYGMSEGYAFRDESVFLNAPTEPGTAVGVYTDEPVAAGYLTPEVTKLVPGKLSVAARRVGSGRVALFADSPNFRGFFRAQEEIFLNAVLFGEAW